jgi:hypothetical protein
VMIRCPCRRRVNQFVDRAQQSYRRMKRGEKITGAVNSDQSPDCQRSILTARSEVRHARNADCLAAHRLDGAIAVFVSLDLPDKLLWIPGLLALAGVFGSILPVVIAPNVALVANAATLTLFIVSLENLRPKPRRAIAFRSHRR